MKPRGHAGILEAGPSRSSRLRIAVASAITGACLLLCGSTSAPQAGPPIKDEAVVVADGVLKDGLTLMGEDDYLGLGAEAFEIAAWIRLHQKPITLESEEGRLRDGVRETKRLSPLMARTLSRLNQWYGLQAPEDNPITHEQLQTAALSRASVARVRRIFESCLERAVLVEGRWVVPEAGGEATLDESLRLVEGVDSRWSTVRELVAAADPAAVAQLAAKGMPKVAEVDTHQLLRLALERFRLGLRGAAEEVLRAVATIALNTAATYTHDPEAQFNLIAGTDWSGRYVGRWHTHSPRDAGGRWIGAEGPSFEDMENAVRDGQYLTIAFQPDGFDLFDGQPLAEAGRVDVGLLKVVRYRSPKWRDHFQALLELTRQRPAR